MADALVLGTSSNGVRVQVPSPAYKKAGPWIEIRACLFVCGFGWKA